MTKSWTSKGEKIIPETFLGLKGVYDRKRVMIKKKIAQKRGADSKGRQKHTEVATWKERER